MKTLVGAGHSAPNIPILRTSERLTFRRCQQRWWWGHREGLVKNGPPALALWIGTGIHIALAEWYLSGKKRGVHPVKTWQKFYKDEMIWLHAKNYDSGEFESALDLGISMLEGYIEKWGADSHWNVLAPEYQGAVDIPDARGIPKVRYVFTCDVVVLDEETGDIKIIEHKSGAQITTSHLTLDDQAGSYLPMMTAKLRAEGILSPRQRINTIEYNFLRKAEEKADDRPVNAEGLRLNADGSVSKRQAVQADLYRRVPVFRSDRERRTQVERILSETKHMNMIRDGRLAPYKNTTRGCGGGAGESKCPFFEVCELHEQKGDWEGLRDATMHIADPYHTYRKVA